MYPNHKMKDFFLFLTIFIDIYIQCSIWKKSKDEYVYQFN